MHRFFSAVADVRFRFSHRTLAALLAVTLLGPTGALAQVEVTTLANFNGNGGITVHPDNTIYVANFGNVNLANGTEVTKLSPDGSTEPFVNLGNAMSGNDFDSQGNLIQSAWGSSIVRRIAPDGSSTTLGTVPNPVGVAVDSNDTIFVTSCPGGSSLGNIRRYNGSTFVVHATDPGFICPNGLTLADDGNLYTLTWGTNDVYRIEPDGTVTRIVDLPGGGAHLTYSNGFFYLASRTSNQIVRVDMQGNSEVLAGTGMDGNADGPGDQATFSQPNGIAVSNDGTTLYVNGTSAIGNGFNAIRQITLEQGIGYLVDAAISGSWFDPTHDGEGFLIEILDENTALVYWFTYNASGRQRWFVGVGDIVDDQIIVDELIETSGPSFGPDYNPDDVEAEVAGSLSIRFSTCGEGIADYEIYSRTGQLLVQRLTSIFGLECATAN